MAEIYVAIRNQDGVAMPSVNGELVIILVTKDRRFQAQKPVALQDAMALFFNLPTGAYTVIARHSGLNPTEVRQDVDLSDLDIFGVRFVYNRLLQE
jgi:hypothetical protein